MIPLLLLGLSALVATGEDGALRARANEVRNRLGLREEKTTDLRGVLLRLRREAWGRWDAKDEAVRRRDWVDWLGALWWSLEPYTFPWLKSPKALELPPAGMTIQDQRFVPFLFRSWAQAIDSGQGLQVGFARLGDFRRRGIRDWMVATSVDPDRAEWAEAWHEAADWHLRLARGATTGPAGPADTRVHHAWKDGWTLYELLTPIALQAEGEAMGHCVGQGSYDEGVRQGAIRIFSLRDPKGHSRVTVEASVLDMHRGSTPLLYIGQAHGKANTNPKGTLATKTIRALLALNPRVDHWSVDALALFPLTHIVEMASDEGILPDDSENFLSALQEAAISRLKAGVDEDAAWHVHEINPTVAGFHAGLESAEFVLELRAQDARRVDWLAIHLDVRLPAESEDARVVQVRLLVFSPADPDEPGDDPTDAICFLDERRFTTAVEAPRLVKDLVAFGTAYIEERALRVEEANNTAFALKKRGSPLTALQAMDRAMLAWLDDNGAHRTRGGG